MKTAKVFKSGGGQAIQLPTGFRVTGSKVFLRRVPEGILISERDPWEAFEKGCRALSDGFMKTRGKLRAQKRRWW